MNKQPYHNLVVWKEAHKFVLVVYQATEMFPKHEIYAMTSQLRRAAVSIPTNLVEGNAKQTAKDFTKFINIAEGSSKECAYLLELSRDLKYISIEM